VAGSEVVVAVPSEGVLSKVEEEEVEDIRAKDTCWWRFMGTAEGFRC
jgi:hypothetical protein